MPNFVEVLEIIDITPTVYLLRMNVIEPKNLDFKPGQFISFVLQKENKRIMKAYSIASPPSFKDYIETCIKIVPGGFVSNYLHGLKSGERLEFLGPSGIFTLKYPLEGDAVFAATGTGISALRPMIHTIFEKGTDKHVWLFYGVRTEPELAYHEEFRVLAETNENFHYVPVLSRPDRPWDGETGHVQEPLQKHITNAQGKDVYICGVLKMVEEVKALAEQMGFEKHKIHVERYV